MSHSASAPPVKMKETGSSDVSAVSNGKNSNGEAHAKKLKTDTARNQRRKEWWNKKNKKSDNKSTAATKFHLDNSEETDKNTVSQELENDDDSQTSQRSKLRNRETIAKPESLKYEHDYNKGFHSKIMQSLYSEPSNKKKKNSKKTFTEAQKRKATSDHEATKKQRTAEESETLDLYKFSLNLINGEVDTSKTKSSKDSKNKYVLFIGNLPYDITREQLEEHFRKTGGIKSIRIPRDRSTDKGRGFAYMEFDGRISHGIALRLHQTTLGGRKINVEFTSIGGGKSEARKLKLKQKNLKRQNMKIQY